ncbi:hypothetical protein ACWGH5_37485 [Streptomyces sp. NPDC054864]
MGRPRPGLRGPGDAVEPGLALTVSTAEPDSLSGQGLRLLASWSATDDAGSSSRPLTAD